MYRSWCPSYDFYLFRIYLSSITPSVYIPGHYQTTGKSRQYKLYNDFNYLKFQLKIRRKEGMSRVRGEIVFSDFRMRIGKGCEGEGAAKKSPVVNPPSNGSEKRRAVSRTGTIRDTGAITYRCFLPDLTRFVTACCAAAVRNGLLFFAYCPQGGNSAPHKRISGTGHRYHPAYHNRNRYYKSNRFRFQG